MEDVFGECDWKKVDDIYGECEHEHEFFIIIIIYYTTMFSLVDTLGSCF